MMDNLGRELLLDHYDANIKPHRQVNVTLQMWLRRVYELDLKKGFHEMQVTLRQSWHDPRLEYQSKPQYSSVEVFRLGKQLTKKIWKPDTFFKNEIDSQILTGMEPNQYIRIFPDGKVLWSVRMNVKTVCTEDDIEEMNQVRCDIQLASYSWQENHLQYFWSSQLPYAIDVFSYDKTSRMFDGPKGRILDVESLSVDTDMVITSTGIYSQANLHLHYNQTILGPMYCIFEKSRWA